MVLTAFQAGLVVRTIRRGVADLLALVALKNWSFELDSESLEVDSDSIGYDFV